jgi:hypothetical protein
VISSIYIHRQSEIIMSGMGQIRAGAIISGKIQESL